MKTEKIKSSEPIIIKKILAWQVAQTLGCKNEADLKEHAMLIAVDHDDDTFFPLMIGEYFKIFIDAEKTASWNDCASRMIKTYIEEDNDDMRSFFGKEGAKSKWAQKIDFESLDFVTRKDNVPKWTHAVRHLFERDGHLHSIYWFVEVDQYHQSRNAISFLAEHDALTGLYNRHKLDDFIGKPAAEGAASEKVYYILFDLDYFKVINDSYGHSNGDRALIAFARHLESVFFHKTYNTIFRLGGDEFLVIATYIDEEILQPYIKEACKGVDVLLEDGTTIRVNCSCGCGHDINSADEALYAVKRSRKQ